MEDFFLKVPGRQGLRTWLQKNALQQESVWLYRPKKGQSGYMTYDEIVEELICFGWIDSLPKKYNENASLLRISPRKKGSSWSKKNKERYEICLQKGLLSLHAQKLMKEAKKDGSWDRLEAVERLEVPADLLDALKQNPLAKKYFDL